MNSIAILKLFNLVITVFDKWLDKQNDEKLIELGKLKQINIHTQSLLKAKAVSRKIMESEVTEEDKKLADDVWGNDG